MTKERPILFNTDMVLAILDDRKTVTRRIVKPGQKKRKYAKPGDLLYVKETWKPIAWSESGDNWDLRYRADGNSNTVKHLFDDEEKELDFWIKITDELKATECEEVDEMFREPERYLKWRPSIFMPKNAARIWLLVKDVRVERLQDITEEDAKAEGIEYRNGYWMGGLHKVKGTHKCRPFARDAFIDLWDSINADRGYGWAANPYVWRVEFEVITKTGRNYA